jgi:hypothetical protein
MRPIVNDINKVLEGKVEDKELIDFVAALKAYSISRGIGKLGSQKHVDLLLLISAILDIPQEGFNELLNRLNIIRLQQVGIFPTTTGMKH